MKTAVILGSEGQDGKLLYDLLASLGYRILGISAGEVRTKGLSWTEAVDITSPAEVSSMIKAVQPEELYHLAAVHHSSEENSGENLEAFQKAYAVNFFSLIHCLEAVRVHSPKTRVFYAASSHIFGEPPTDVQDETTPLNPDSVYGMTKADGLLACRLYRKKYGLHASTGILYTHESQYREEKFLSKKVVRAVADFKKGIRREKLVIGDLSAAIDWGYAPEYVDAMNRVLQLAEGNEFVFATGRRNTVSDFVQAAFEAAGLNFKDFVEERPGILIRKGPPRIGNPEKLMKMTGWKPETDLKAMARLLLQFEGIQPKNS